jgi:hypothetical protein
MQEVEMVKTIRVTGKSDKGSEVNVCHGASPPKMEAWSYEEFSREWSKTYITDQRKRNLK